MGVGESLLAGLAGGLKGGLNQYSWQKDYEQKDRQIVSNAEMQRLRQYVLLALGDVRAKSALDVAGAKAAADLTKAQELNAGRERVAKTITASQEIIAKLQEGGKNTRFDRPSGNVLTEEFGRNMRWDRSSGNANLGAFTTQRGQDITAATAANAQSAVERMGLTTNDTRLIENATRAKIEADKLRNRNSLGSYSFGGNPTTELKDGTGKPTATPIEVAEPPVTPLPKSDGAAEDQRAQLAAQIQAAVQRFDRATTTSAKLAAQQEILRLQARLPKP